MGADLEFPNRETNSFPVNEFRIETLRLKAILGALKRWEDVQVVRPPFR